MGTRITWFTLLVCNAFICFGQDLVTRKHLVGASSTIAVGFQRNNPDANIYVHSFAYFHPEPKVSIDGELYWYTGAQNNQTLMAENSSLIFGPNYHLTSDGSFDPFVGIMPGFSLVSATDWSIPQAQASELSLVPIITINGGVKYHFHRVFNVFLNLRYIQGSLIQGHSNALTLNEIRVSFGLGFNFYSKKAATTQ